MASLLSLPTEIHRQCFSYLDGSTLKSLRSTCKAFKDLATEALFNLVTLRVTERSAQKFTTLIKIANIQRYVRTLQLEPQIDKFVPYEDCCSRPLQEWWKEAVAGWSKITLPNLRKVVLDTAWACVSKGHCESLVFALTEFLSHNKVDSLTIKHLQDLCPNQSLDFARFPIIPKKLNLLITTWTDDAAPEHDIDNYQRHAFFNERLTPIWLSPTQSQLTHLTIHCNTYWGMFPRWQPEGLHFPALKSLALSKWTIASNSQLDFITSHGPTLEQLILTDCPILHASRRRAHQINNTWRQGPPGTSRGKPPTTETFFDTRWHHVLPAFQHQLPKLTHFSMARGPVGHVFSNRADVSADEAFDDRYAQVPEIDPSRYAIFDYTLGTIPYEFARFDWRTSVDDMESRFSWFERERWSWLDRETDEDLKRRIAFPDCLREDQEALEGLLRVVRERV